MDISLMSVKILLLFTPGLIVTYLVNYLTVPAEKSLHDVICTSFIYGFISYLVYYTLVYFADGCKKIDVTILDFISKETVPINYEEVFWVCIVSVIVAFIISFCINKMTVLRIAKFLRICEKTGHTSILGFLMDVNGDESSLDKWVVVKDYQTGLAYYGYLQLYSTAYDKFDELFLTDVVVYNKDSGDVLYESDAVYLPRKRDQLSIEWNVKEHEYGGEENE